MLPRPFSRWIPGEFQDGDDPARDALCAHVDLLMDTAEAEALGVGMIPDPARASSRLLEGIGAMLEAGVGPSDTEAVRRRKVRNAVRSHKNRSTWGPSAKLIVDSAVGGDSRLVSFLGSDDFILCGSGSEPDSYLWSAMGGLDPDAGYGTRLVGVGSSSGGDLGTFVEPIKGTVLIDVGSSTLTAAQVEAVKLALQDSTASYLRVYLGYSDGDRFVPYGNGLM